MTMCEAYVTCANPVRLMTRLCRHWSHKFEVQLDEGQGSVAFPDGACEFTANAGVLHVRLQMPEDSQARLQPVVAEHLQRMASDEPLEVQWRTGLE